MIHVAHKHPYDLTQVGFCDAVDEPTARAHRREELLELVFKAYAQLWDEALGVRC
jgi:hypothetical protein